MASPTLVGARDGYRLWAPSYADETVVSDLDQRLVAELTPPLAGRRLLDAGCGAGRRLRGAGAATAVGVDLCPEMLEAGAALGPFDPGIRTLVGDVRDMPLPDRSFDVVWCRLVAGHLPDCRPLYRELARVADDGALVVVTDFHPEAHAAGHRRTFRTAGRAYELEHHLHAIEAHLQAAEAAGLRLTQRRDGAVGPEVRSYYEAAGRLGRYRRDLGLPLVLALAFRREG